MNPSQAPVSYLTWIDYAIICVYLLGTVAIGTWFHRRQKSTEDYFVASRRMHWIPLALSIWSGLTSANSMIGGPGYTYAHDLQQIWIVFEAMVVYVIVIYLILPILFPLKLTTAYTYLEMRFNLATRLLGSALFILLRFSWLASVMYAPSKAMAAIVRLPLSEQWMQAWAGMGLDGSTAAWVLIIGLTTTLYATLGGMEGVIWTDFVQALVMMAGLVTILVMAINGLPEGVVTLYHSLANDSHGRLFDFSFDMQERNLLAAPGLHHHGPLKRLGHRPGGLAALLQCQVHERLPRVALAIGDLRHGADAADLLFGCGVVGLFCLQSRPQSAARRGWAG